MEVSNRNGQQGGQELLDTVAQLTGLPEPLVQQELYEILESAGQNAGSVTLDQLRQAMLIYLEALAVEAESHPEADQLDCDLDTQTHSDFSFIPS